MFNADLTQKEIDPPENRWCASGHEAPALFKRAGPDSFPEPTKFFQVSTKEGRTDGIYCEPCLVIAHFMANKIRKERKDKI